MLGHIQKKLSSFQENCTPMTQKTEKTEILIAGAGVAGLALAILLGQKGFLVTVIDKGPPPAPFAQTKPSGRTVALMQSSASLLRQARVWERIVPQGGAMHTMRLIDDSGPRRFSGAKLDFQAGEAGFESFGLNVPISFLRAALWEKSSDFNTIKIIPGAGLSRFEDRGGAILVRTEEGKEEGQAFSASLLVGADGARSRVREQAGIPCQMHDYGQKAMTCLIRHSRPHLNISTEFHRPSGPFALVPLPGQRSSVVWVEPGARADSLFALPPDAFAAALQEKTLGLLGDVTLESAPEIWPLRNLRAERLTAPRVALIAEAAHVMSPITAQGLNLSLRDVGDLAAVLGENRVLGIDPGAPAPLLKYEKLRRADILTRTSGVDALMRLVSTDRPLPRLLRRSAFQAVSLIPLLRKLSILYGMGLGPFRKTG